MAEPLSKGEFIAKTVESKNKQDRHNNDVYSCELEDRQGITYEDVYVARKRDLNQGDELYGRVEQNEYGYRFFAMQREDGAAPKSNGSPPRNRADANGDSIEAQVALKAAVEWGIAKDATTDQVAQITTRFAQAIREAKAA